MKWPHAFWRGATVEPRIFIRWFVNTGADFHHAANYDVYGVGARGQPIGPLYRVRVVRKSHALERIPS